MEYTTFKDRVREVAIKYAKDYQKQFVDYDYLVLSKAFAERDYYIIKCETTNYLHLVGVNALVSATVFFEKCYSGTLELDDFDFNKNGQPEQNTKGYVRKKIKVLPNMINMFNVDLLAEESFVKNNVSCSFATTDNTFTVGFTTTNNVRPKTLLKGNELHNGKTVDIVLRRPRGTKLFNEIIYQNPSTVKEYLPKITDLITENLFD